LLSVLPPWPAPARPPAPIPWVGGAPPGRRAPRGPPRPPPRARTLLLPAALGEIHIQGPADVLIGYVPDLDRDIRAPLLAAGHGPAAIAALGEGLGPR
ncbi:hypothetical protein ABZ016_26680, partial [Streptomyces sp. NPDC006372]